MSEENEENIPRHSSQEEYCQKAFFSSCPNEEASQKIQGYHIEYDMGQAAVDKHTAYDGPRLLREQRGCQSEKADNFISGCDGVPTNRYLNYEEYNI